MNGGSGMAPVLSDKKDKNQEMAEGEKPTGCGGRSTVETDEPSMASPRLIPVLDSPLHSARPFPGPVLGDTGRTSESFDRKCAPSRAPRCASTDYDQISYDQLHELCKQRGYHKEDAKAVIKTRQEATGAAERRPTEGAADDMDTSSSVPGKKGSQHGGAFDC